MLDAALAGFGLAYLPEDSVQAHLADGRLIALRYRGAPHTVQNS